MSVSALVLAARRPGIEDPLAKKAGVVCIPGAYFGEHQGAYLRFAFANADADTIATLADRLGGFTP